MNKIILCIYLLLSYELISTVIGIVYRKRYKYIKDKDNFRVYENGKKILSINIIAIVLLLIGYIFEKFTVIHIGLFMIICSVIFIFIGFYYRNPAAIEFIFYVMAINGNVMADMIRHLVSACGLK